MEPDLARNWHYNRQDRSLSIELRRDAKFHDGTPVTSEDVIFSIQQQIDGLFQDSKRAILKIDPISKHDFKIILPHDQPEFFKFVYKTMILPRHLSLASHRDHPIGSGPYRFEKKLDDRHIRLSAFHDYYGGSPAIEHVLFTHVTDMEKTWTRLLAGKTDIAARLAPDNFRRMKFIQQRYHINQSPSWFCKTLLFNPADPRLADVRVRRALSLGIDRDHIVEKIFIGYGRVATGPLGVGSPYGRSDRPPRPYDPVAARELLNDAGWEMDTVTELFQKGGLRLEFDLLYMRENPIDEKVVRFIQLCLGDLGVRVRPVPVDYATLQQSYRGNTDFQAVLTETMGLYDSHTPLLLTWMPNEKGCSNMGDFTSPRITELLMALENADSMQAQQAICQAVEDQLLALQPAAFLYQPTEIDVVSKRIHLPHVFAADTGSIRCLYQAHILSHR
ncbi:ABC transporter substrate-binding protein [Desulfosarcina ovata]|uniref:Peptide-binding protein n=1 Tax=Desulfosarcina ovata subsp. ovata TaxID=2752305 RepID=A0A5K8ADI9_9BACT|nr:ABC transporter substrate-binding protein [Desulfosarcina ovata]BBO90064.1 peptide-binding protein [Desulfosarcina ovata subsp. ovata]